MMDENYCSVSDISFFYIQSEVSRKIHQHTDLIIDSVFLSVDLYKELYRQTLEYLNKNIGSCAHKDIWPEINSPIDQNIEVAKVLLLNGTTSIIVVPHLSEFCHVGTLSTFNSAINNQINRAFEEYLLYT